MASGIRCAETTSASKFTSNSRSASPAAPITGQSESEPITIPTLGRELSSGIGVSHQVRGGMPGPLLCLDKIISVGGDMAYLATGTYLLAVQLHPQPPVSGKTMQQGRWKIIDLPTEDIGHHRPPVDAGRFAERQIEHGP